MRSRGLFLAPLSLLVLAGCVPVPLPPLGPGDVSIESQDRWIAEMRQIYTPGMPLDEVRQSAGFSEVTFAEAPEAPGRIANASAAGGTGSWYRFTAVHSIPQCDLASSAYMHFDAADRLVAVHRGESRCI